MHTGEVPDSDPGLPELDPQVPRWVLLGINAQSLVPSPLIPTSNDAADNDAADDRISNTDLQNASLRATIEPEAPPSVISQHSEHTSNSGYSRNSTAPRRRNRFNFEQWVAEDKRTHEYIYRKRFKNFHGPLSDSEDEDYAELQAGDEDSDTGQYIASQQEDTIGERDESQLGTINRRRKLIDSESSESDDAADADPEPTVENLSTVAAFRKKLTRSIPAVPKDYVRKGEPKNNSVESLSDFSETLPSQDPDGYSLTNNDNHSSIPEPGTNGLGTEARESRDWVDHMMSYPRTRKLRRGKHASKAGSVSEIEKRAGPVTPNALRIAARTAMRMRKRNAAAKLASANRAQTPTPPREQPREQRPRGLRSKRPEPMGKLFVNQSNDTMKTLKKWQKQGLEAVLPSYEPSKSSSEDDVPSKHSGRKRKRRRFRRSENPHMRTPIIENQLAPVMLNRGATNEAKPVYEHRSKMSKSAPRKPSGLSAASKPREYRQVSSESILGYPSKRLNLNEFDRSTFLGSNIGELLDGPTIWNGLKSVSHPTLLSHPVNLVSETAIVSDAAMILELCSTSSVDSTAYDEIYDYFLHGSAYLCDESEIVEASFVGFVLHEWLRLARKLLKSSIRKRWNIVETTDEVSYSGLVVELVTLSLLVVFQRVKIMRPSESRDLKLKSLLMWVIYYHQSVISLQVERVVYRTTRSRVGAELVYFSARFGSLDKISHILLRSSSQRAMWHLMELISATYSYISDWDTVRQLLAYDIQRSQDIRLSMTFILRLLAKWEWPASTEVVVDLFNYYAKQQHYADPNGESIWLPSFLIESNFDGRARLDQDFSVFLEILGFTLKRYQYDRTSQLKLSGRVTPLSALAFPEHREVSLADLSSASHQYSILIVLLRILDYQNRPSISQFRDLVVLRDAHWAIKIKAVSAWKIVATLVKSEDIHECLLWMRDDILQGSNLPDALVHIALESSLDIISVAFDAVPIAKLTELGTNSRNAATRNLLWRLLAACGNRIEELMRDLPLYDYYGDEDIQKISLVAKSMSSDIISTWQYNGKVSESLARKMYANILRAGAFKLRSQLPAALTFLLLDSLARPELNLDDQNLLSAADIKAFQSSSERRIAIRDLVSQVSLDQHHWERLLESVRDQLSSMDASNAAVYLPVVVEIRRAAFGQFPVLQSNDDAAKYNGLRALETMRDNVINFAETGDTASYYYFVYRLRQFCNDGSEFSSNNANESTFVAELSDALSDSDSSKTRKLSDVAFNKIFASFFLLADRTYSRTLKSRISYILPVLTKAVIANVGRAANLQLDYSRLIQSIVSYLAHRSNVDIMIASHPPTCSLISLFSTLAIQWLHQSYATAKRNTRLARWIFLLARQLENQLKTCENPHLARELLDVDDLASLDQTPYIANLLEIGEDVTSAFYSEVPDDERSIGPPKPEVLKQIQALLQHCVIYITTKN